jgi:hypothetical protein
MLQSHRLLAQNKPHSVEQLNDQQGLIIKEWTQSGDNKENSITLVVNCLYPGFGSALWRKNDAEHYSLIQAFLPGSADMSATIWRHHIVDPVIGNRRPFAVHFDLVMVADHAALRRPAVHEVTAGASAVVSVELWVKLPMPPIVADPVISFLRHRV